jgi:hypothetical protein
MHIAPPNPEPWTLGPLYLSSNLKYIDKARLLT